MGFPTYSEALRAVTASCDLGIVGVSVIAVIVARASLAVVSAVIGAAIVGGWLFVADVANPLGRTGSTITHVIVLIAALVGVFVLRSRPWIAAGVAGIAELLTTVWWRPCVGTELAHLLNHESGPIATGLGMAVYMLGLLTPAIVAACLIHVVWMPSRRTTRPSTA